MADTNDLLQELINLVRAQQASIELQQQAIASLAELVEGQNRLPQLATEKSSESAEPEKPDLRRKPVDWLSVTGRERLGAWQGLAYFVEVLVYRYNLHLEIRPCWWRHADAVEELTALWHTRQMSYRDDADLDKAYTWQDALAKARDRLRFMFVACFEGHIDNTIRTEWMSEEIRQDFARTVQRDVLASEGRVPEQ